MTDLLTQMSSFLFLSQGEPGPQPFGNVLLRQYPEHGPYILS